MIARRFMGWFVFASIWVTIAYVSLFIPAMFLRALIMWLRGP
jgi:hypothetical protein